MKTQFNKSDEILAYLEESDNLHGSKVINLRNCIFSFKLDLELLFKSLNERYNDFNLLDFSGSNFKHPLNLNLNKQERVNDNSINYEELKSSKTKIYFKIDFSGCHFFEAVRFSGIVFNQDLNFIGATFKKKVQFSELVFKGYLRLFEASFQKDVHFANLELNNKSIFFTGKDDKTKFEGNLYFQDVVFYEAKFWDFVFKKDVVFLNTVFNCPAFFNNSKFLGKTSFSSLETIGLTEFKDKVYFDNAEISELKLERLTFEKLVSFNYATIKNISIDNVHCVGYPLSLDGTKLNAVKNEGTARFLKSEAMKSNNPFLIAELNAKEMTMHYNELKWKNKFFDKLAFCFNKNSTNFGERWEKGVWFIFLSWIISFSLIVMIRDGIGWTFIWFDNDYLKEAINFLWKFGNLDVLGNSCVGFQIFVFTLGKILIAYGVYQTIAAFRKYGKK